MSFFEAPPSPEPEPFEERPQPAWAGPPEHILGVGVPLRLVLARTEDLAVLLDHVTAFPTGVEFDVTIHLRRLPDEPYHDLFHEMHMWRHRRRGVEGLPPELFRFGVELADGGKATSLGEHWPAGPSDASTPSRPVLMHRGGGGGARRYTFGYWLWPLPPRGPVAFVVEWPAQGISLTRMEVDAEPIREAATRAETLWPPEADSDGGFTSYGHIAFEDTHREED